MVDLLFSIILAYSSTLNLKVKHSHHIENYVQIQFVYTIYGHTLIHAKFPLSTPLVSRLIM